MCECPRNMTMISTDRWLCRLLSLQSLQTLEADRRISYQSNALLLLSDFSHQAVQTWVRCRTRHCHKAREQTQRLCDERRCTWFWERRITERSWKCLDKTLPVPQSLTLSQLSKGFTPGLPSSPFSPLAPAMPGTPGNPWEQPSPQSPWRHTHTTVFMPKVTEHNKTPFPKMHFSSWTYITVCSSGVLRQLVWSNGILQKGQGSTNWINIHLGTFWHKLQ